MKTGGTPVRFSGVTCEACGCDFQIPLPGEQAAGELILKGRRAFGYCNALDEEAWDDIRDRLASHGVPAGPLADQQQMQMHDVIAAAADPIGGEKLSSRHVCPMCGSAKLAGQPRPGELRRVPSVTFTRYLTLSLAERNTLVAKLWHEVALPASQT